MTDEHPPVESDCESEKTTEEHCCETEGDSTSTVKNRMETPKVEELGPVENVGYVGEPNHAVNPNQAVDGG